MICSHWIHKINLHNIMYIHNIYIIMSSSLCLLKLYCFVLLCPCQVSPSPSACFCGLSQIRESIIVYKKTNWNLYTLDEITQKLCTVKHLCLRKMQRLCFYNITWATIKNKTAILEIRNTLTVNHCILKTGCGYTSETRRKTPLTPHQEIRIPSTAYHRN